MAKTPESADILYTPLSTQALLRPLSERGEEWVRDNLESTASQWVGGRLAIDARHAPFILRDMRRDSLVVAGD